MLNVHVVPSEETVLQEFARRIQEMPAQEWDQWCQDNMAQESNIDLDASIAANIADVEQQEYNYSA